MGRENLKISIITINYNNTEGLEKTIRSVLGQHYVNIEYIIIDGNSTDGSKDVIFKYRDQITYWVSEPDSGIYNAMNKGIKASSGDYLLFINSGDFLIDESIVEKVVDKGLSHDLVYGNLILVNGEVRKNWIPADELSFQVFYTSGIPHPGTFIKKELFELVGLYNETYQIVSDWEFFLLATCKYQVSYKHLDLFICEFCEDGISSNPVNSKKIEDERKLVLKAHFPLFLTDYQEYNILMKEIRKVMFFVKARRFFKQFKRVKRNA